MKGLKKFYLTAVIGLTLMITGCGTVSDEVRGDTILFGGREESGQTDTQNVDALPKSENPDDSQAQEDETTSFVFSMSTSYSKGNEDYTGGYIISGTMRTGDRAVIVKSDGLSFEAKIERLALSQDDGDPLPVSEAEEGSSIVYVWLEKNTSYDWREWPPELRTWPDELQTGDSLLGTKEWEQGIPVDFPFKESEEYTLTFAPQEQGFAVKEQEKRQGEFRLYNRDGAVVQRIPYGKYQLPFSSYVFCKNDRSNLLFFPDEESNVGRVMEWDEDDGRFLEGETDKKWRGHLLTEETDTELIEERYGFQEDGIALERKRSFTLRKDTGELRIWDDIAGECLFEATAELDKDGNPANQDYYNFLFRNAPYDQSDDYDPKVYMDLEYENEEWHEVSYESKEAFLAEYGVENSTPRYQSCDRYGNPRLELYEDQSGEQFCGIIYRKYYVTNKKEKWAKMYGFTISKEKTEKEKWSDNTYSIMSKIGPDDEKGYEETIEYTEDEKPIHFESRGLAEVKNGSSIEEELIPLMEVDYIYRDDGTLFYRGYWHTTYLYMTNDHVLSSFYDEKERVVYEDGYITSGDQEYYYVYEDDGNVPICKLDVRYIHGGIDVNPTWYY